MWSLNPNGLVFLQKGNESQRRPQGCAEVKSSPCSWSCDTQTNENIKASFLNPKLLTFLELQSISCIVFAHVTCNTSNRGGGGNDDFVLSIYFCKDLQDLCG